MSGKWESVADIGDQFADGVAQASAKFLELGALGPGRVAVDLGCGAGGLGREVARRVGDSGQVFGVDLSARMIDVARQRAAGLANLELVVQDAAALSLPAASCDAVFCRFSLPCFADPGAALARAVAVLKPGGRVAVMGIGGVEHNEFFTAVGAAGGPMLERAHWFGEVNRLSHALAEAGGESVKARSVRALITVQDAAAYWNTVRSVLGIADPVVPAAVADRVRPGMRLSLELVFALALGRDPSAKLRRTVRSLDDVVSAARRKIRELSPHEVKRKLKRDQVVYLDVREPDGRQEWIKGSVHIPRGLLEERIAQVVPDPEATVLVYCERGNQGPLAAKQLQDLGYENVWSLNGGLNAWQADGMPAEKV